MGCKGAPCSHGSFLTQPSPGRCSGHRTVDHPPNGGRSGGGPQNETPRYVVRPPRLPSQVCHSPGCATPGSACRLTWSGSLTHSVPPGAGPGWSGGQCTPTGSWPSWPPSGTAGRRGTRQSVPPGPPAAVPSREATLLGPGRGQPEKQRAVSGGTAEDRALGLQKHGVFIFVQAGSRSSIRDSEEGLKAAALESQCAV